MHAARRKACGACRRRCCERCPGYEPDVAKNRAEAREIMEKLGYGPDKRLEVKVSTRNIPLYRDPAVILIDQLKEIYIDGELELVDTANWFPKVARKDFTVGAQRHRERRRRPRPAYSTRTSSAASERNYTGYCNPEIDKLIDRAIGASATPTSASSWCGRSRRKLAEDGARPIIMCTSVGAPAGIPTSRG